MQPDKAFPKRFVFPAMLHLEILRPNVRAPLDVFLSSSETLHWSSSGGSAGVPSLVFTKHISMPEIKPRKDASLSSLPDFSYLWKTYKRREKYILDKLNSPIPAS